MTYILERAVQPVPLLLLAIQRIPPPQLCIPIQHPVVKKFAIGLGRVVVRHPLGQTVVAA